MYDAENVEFKFFRLRRHLKASRNEKSLHRKWLSVTNVHILRDWFSVRFGNLSDTMWTMLSEIEYAIPKINMLHSLSCYETRLMPLGRWYSMHSSLNLVFRQYKVRNIFIFGMAYWAAFDRSISAVFFSKATYPRVQESDNEIMFQQRADLRNSPFTLIPKRSTEAMRWIWNTSVLK